MQLMWGAWVELAAVCTMVNLLTLYQLVQHWLEVHTHTHGKMNVRNYVFLIRKFLCCDDVVKSANRVSVINQGKSKIFKRLHAENCAEAIL